MLSVDWNIALISVLLTIIGFCTLWGFSLYYKRKNTSSLKLAFSSRLLGILVYGVIPIFLISNLNQDLSFLFKPIAINTISLLVLVLFITIILGVNYSLSKKKEHQQKYPQVKLNQWNVSVYTINLLTWIMYLLSYELLFRGILLFSCIQEWGVFVAILINTALYALAHLYKGKFETIGSIPLGVLFCLISIYTGNFWAAFILHCTIALSNDIFCIWNNPEIVFKH